MRVTEGIMLSAEDEDLGIIYLGFFNQGFECDCMYEKCVCGAEIKSV